MRSDHREKKEAESQKTNWRSDLAPFVFSTKSWRVKSATQRVSFVIVFPKNVLGQKKNTHWWANMSVVFFAWGQIPERMRNQRILKSLRPCIWFGCVKGTRLISHCFNLIFQYDLPKTVKINVENKSAVLAQDTDVYVSILCVSVGRGWGWGGGGGGGRCSSQNPLHTSPTLYTDRSIIHMYVYILRS